MQLIDIYECIQLPSVEELSRLDKEFTDDFKVAIESIDKNDIAKFKHTIKRLDRNIFSKIDRYRDVIARLNSEKKSSANVISTFEKSNLPLRIKTLNSNSPSKVILHNLMKFKSSDKLPSILKGIDKFKNHPANRLNVLLSTGLFPNRENNKISILVDRNKKLEILTVTYNLKFYHNKVKELAKDLLLMNLVVNSEIYPNKLDKLYKSLNSYIKSINIEDEILRHKVILLAYKEVNEITRCTMRMIVSLNRLYKRLLHTHSTEGIDNVLDYLDNSNKGN